jgi:hypothetical protein
MNKIIAGAFAALVFFALAYQACEIRKWKNAWLEDAVRKDKQLIAMQQGMAAINAKHDPAIAGIQADILVIKQDGQAIRARIGALHVPTAAEILTMAEDASIACEDRLAQAVASFTTCRNQVDSYGALVLSQDQEIKRWTDLDIERQAKDKETQAAFKECLDNYQRQAAALILAQRKAGEVLILYVGTGAAVYQQDGQAKVAPALHIGLGLKIKGWRLWK